jgi:(E)-4-hydroxy-3-methylbut-2-enyl-diphosphate synthase
MSVQAVFRSREIKVGSKTIGGSQPIVVQSMTTTDTMKIDETVAQVEALIEAGCEVVRITAPTVQDAEALKEISDRVGGRVPLVADIHFLPAAALIAADYVDKVRINPGNFADRKMFKVIEYTDEDYAKELVRIEEKFKPLVLKAKTLGKALRIGTNHGSLSDRIMNRFGDTPEGMIESAFEFAEICRKYDFHDFCFSMKASNVGVMVKAYRLLVQRQQERSWNYPLHLGVTEAGDGEDGRIKSAVGIGTLLDEGMGDTIRVSLTEAAVKEIPVARAIAQRFPRTHTPFVPRYSHLAVPVQSVLPLVWMKAVSIAALKEQLSSTALRPDVIWLESLEDWASEAHLLKLQLKSFFGTSEPRLAVVREHFLKLDERSQKKFKPLVSFWLGDGSSEDDVIAFSGKRALAASSAALNAQQILLSQALRADTTDLERLIEASIEVGSAFVDLPLGHILIEAPSADESLRLSFGILQATRRRMSKTEYISCPSCGRTLFDLEETTARIKVLTSHLKGVKIAVMGCIVNGPGEMADADFGYVGGAPGRVNLYVGKDCVERNIPSAEAPQRLVELIKKHNRWVEPDANVSAA